MSFSCVFLRWRSVVLTLGLAAFCVAAVSWAQEVREWKSAAGKPISISKTENLVGALDLSDDSDPTMVTVETAVGKRYKYPLAKLSADDQKYVEAERAKKAAPPEDDFVADPDLIVVEEETQSTRTGGDSTSNSDGRRALAAVPKDGVKRALLVGVDDYAEFADLKYAVADVEAIRERLVALGFKPENIVELKSTSPLNLTPTQRNIDRQIDALLDSVGPNDLVFLHFSGHGFESDGAVRFAPLDAVATGDERVVDAKTTISLTEVMERLKTSKAKFKWMIIDACHENPTGTRSAAASAKALKNIDPPPGMLVLQSCSEGELSFEDADAGLGLFTGRLLEAFDGKADLDDDGIVSAQEVCKYARDQTLAASKTRFPAPQTPRMSAVDFGDFVVADDLKKDGLTREEWAQAQMRYEDAVKATEAEKYATALEKIDAALAIVAAVPDSNAEKQRYVDRKKIVERFLALATRPEPQPIAAPQTKPQLVAAPQTKPQSVAAPQTEPQPVAAPQTKPQSVAAPQTKPQPVAAPRPETPADVFKWEFDENGATLCGFKGEALENIVIPAKVDGKPVVAIGECAFRSCRSLKSAEFPNGLQTIAFNAFDGCESLQSVAFPDGLQTIGFGAFGGCESLQSVEFPDGLQTIGDSAFAGCDACKSFSVSAKNPTFHVVDGVLFTADGKTLVAYPSGRQAETYRVPNGVETIGDSAFKDCKSLKLVEFPDGLQTIGETAFSYCFALKLVEFPDGLQTIGEYAFAYCVALKSVAFPDGLQTIGEEAFIECTALQSVAFPDGLQTIGDSAFFECTALQSVAFPDGLQTIGEYAFAGCDACKSFSVSAKNPTFRVVDGVLFTADGKTLVVYPSGRQAETYRVPDGVETIAGSAFSGCRLKSVEFPNGLQTIGSSAFSNCYALQSVAFPDGLQTIDSSAFSYCSELESVSFPDGLRTIGGNAFSNCSALKSVELPSSATYTKDGDYRSFPKSCEIRIRDAK